LPHNNRVYSAAFRPDGARIITASEDGAAHLWDVTWAARLQGDALVHTVARHRLVGAATRRCLTRVEHVVPLAPRALAILREVRATSHSRSGLPGYKPGLPLSDMTLTRVLRDAGLDGKATPHGLRSSFKDWCAEFARTRDEVSEAALAHRIPDKVRAAYLRTRFFGTVLRRTGVRFPHWAQPPPTQ
jgi:integrase